jgi:hypothetical protein
VDTVSFGSSREPKRVRDRWPQRHIPPGRWAWLVVAAAATGVATVVLVTSGGHAQPAAKERLPSSQPLPSLLGGVRARGASTDLLLGGTGFWRLGRQLRPVAVGFLVNGISPLLPPDHSAEADQLIPVPGGVVAHISDTSTGITYGAPGLVVFIPAGNDPPRVIARATMIAVSPGGRQVWLQTAIQSSRNGEGVPASFRSPTWAVDLAGRRIGPVLRLPFGLVGATGSGPLTQNLATGQLQLWNGATGRPIPINVPADADFIAAGQDRVVWGTCAASCQLHVTDLTTGADSAVPLPRGWALPSETYPPPPASFDRSGQLLVLPLARVDSSSDVTGEALFIVSTAARTLRMIPGTSLPVSSASAGQPVELIGSWDWQGLLWVLASSDEDYYQLGYLTGTGPLRTLAPAEGYPVALSAAGSG